MVSKAELLSRRQKQALAARVARIQSVKRQEATREDISSELEEKETGPVFVLKRRDTSAAKGVVDRVVEELPAGISRELAEERAKSLSEGTGEDITVQRFESGEALKEFKERTGGVRVIKTRQERAAEQRGRIMAQESKAIKDATDALSRGEALSTTQKKALEGVKGGKAVIARAEAFEAGVQKLKEGKPLTELEKSTIGEANIKKFKQAEKEFTERFFATTKKQLNESLKETRRLTGLVAPSATAGIEGSPDFVGPPRPTPQIEGSPSFVGPPRPPKDTGFVGPPKPMFLERDLKAPQFQAPEMDRLTLSVPTMAMPDSPDFVGPRLPKDLKRPETNLVVDDESRRVSQLNRNFLSSGSLISNLETKEEKDLNIRQTTFIGGQDETRNVGTLPDSRNDGFFRSQLPLREEEVEKRRFLEERAKRIEIRQREFFSSEGFKRIERTAGLLTFGGGKELEERGFLGQTAQIYTSGLLSFPIVLGGSLALAGEKTLFAFEAIRDVPESKVLFIEESKEVISQIPKTFDPTTPEGAATLLTTGTFALVPTLPKTKTPSPKTGEVQFISRVEVAKAQTPTGLTVLDIAPVEFAVKTGKTQVRGTGLGKGFFEGGELIGKFKFITESPKQPKGFTEVQTKGIVKTVGLESKSIAASRATTQIGKKTIQEKFLSVSAAREIPIAEQPTFIIRTGEIVPSRTGGLQPKTAKVGVIEKVGEIARPERPTVEFFRLGELGKSAEAVKKALEPKAVAKRLFGSKKGQLILEQPKVKAPQGRASPESILTQQFIKSIRKAAEARIPKRGSFIIPATLPITTTATDILTGQAPKTTTIEKKKPSQRRRPISGLEPIEDISQDFSLALGSAQTIQLAQQVRQEPRQQTESILDIPVPTPTPTPPASRSVFFPLLETKRRQVTEMANMLATQDQSAYEVQIRKGEKRGDKYKTVSKNLPRNRALQQGKNITDRFIEASFRIRQLKKKAKIPDILNEPDLSKYRNPRGKTKLSRGTFVEKRKFRIDSEGEKAGLSFFKQLAKRKQALKKQIALRQRQQNFLIAQKQKRRKQTQNFITSQKPLGKVTTKWF